MSEFVENLKGVFVQFGTVQARRMFGEYGVFHDGLMFALLADDVLYLKDDSISSGEFRKRGLEQFEYEKNSQRVKMSYYLAPEEIFENPEEAKVWAGFAFDAALRSRKPLKQVKHNK